jgi:hypothetical protein
MRDSVLDSRLPALRWRRWPLFLPFALVAAAAIVWTGGWFFLAAKADRAIADWRAHEASAGRNYGCGTQSIGGFPFRIEVRCTDPAADLHDVTPPFALHAADTLFAWQVYQPTLVLAEFTGPLAIGEAQKPPSVTANWRLGQASIHAAPSGLERVSVVFDAPTIERVGVAVAGELFKATHAEIHGRPTAGASADNPAVDVALLLDAATAPALHPLAAQPFDADITGVLRGLTDIVSPKPLPVLFKQWQAHSGSIEITRARVQQGDVIVVGTGMLALTARGGLDGQLQVTIVGLDQVLQALGVDQMVSQGDIGSVLNALDRFLPGLGSMARQNAGAGIVAGLGVLGQSTTLEGKPAVTVPLRFDDGAVSLGPLQVGRIPPLF